MRRLLLSCALIFSSLNAHALTVISISGVSSANIVPATTAPTTPGGTPTPAAGTASASAMGGVAGYADLGNNSPSCAVMDGVTPCNSCPTAVCQDSAAPPNPLTPLCACNRARIYDNLSVTVAVSQTSTPLFNVRAASGGTTTGGVSGGEILTTNYNTGAVSFKWNQICALISGGTGTGTCEGVNGQAVVTVYVDKDNSQTFTTGDDSIQVTFRVVSPNATDENVFGIGAKEGIGDFTPYPGDDRIYLKDVNTVQGFPGLSYGIQIASVKMFLSDKNLDSANATIAFDPEGSLDVTANSSDINDGFVDGVHNGTAYYVRLAMQDQAGNIIQYYPDAQGHDAKGNAHPECFGATPDPKVCPFAVIPDPVLGILSKDFNCFIASAAYGTSLEPKLNLFRKFRSDVLLRHNWGRTFVMEYYEYGPYAARFIADKPLLRWMVRGVLWPLAGFSWLALKIGLVKSLALSLLLLTVLAAPAALSMRRYSRRA
jgi:hypothetical protein